MHGSCAAAPLNNWDVSTACTCLQYDQDIVDLLTSLKPDSVTSEGGMYAAAMPPPSLEAEPEADDSLLSLRGSPADHLQVLMLMLRLVVSLSRCTV